MTTDAGSTATDTTAATDTGMAATSDQTAATTTTATDTTDWRAEAEKWKALSRQHEKRSKENAEAAQAATSQRDLLNKVAEALGLSTGEAKQLDPAAVEAKLAAAQAATIAQHRENAVLRAAGRLGADGDALLDSRAFLSSIADLDPTDTAGINAAIAEAVKANPRYATTATTPATPPAPARSTATSFEGAPGGQRQWTAEDVARATPSALTEAISKGLLKNYMSS